MTWNIEEKEDQRQMTGEKNVEKGQANQRIFEALAGWQT